jgi:hypothetical protein
VSSTEDLGQKREEPRKLCKDDTCHEIQQRSVQQKGELVRLTGSVVAENDSDDANKKKGCHRASWASGAKQ